jgi:hypothetical protein
MLGWLAGSAPQACEGRNVQSAVIAASMRSRKMQFTERWTAIENFRLRFRQTAKIPREYPRIRPTFCHGVQRW